MELRLSATKRAKNEKLAVDSIPAILYGKGMESQSLAIKKIDFDKVFKNAGESNLIELDFGSGPVKVLVKDVQRDIMKYTFTHVDFYQVNMKEKITTEIPLHFIGESKAVRELGGMLMKEMHAVEVECLPNDLVDHLDIDVSVLSTFDDVIRLSDVVLPAGLRLTHHADEVVVIAAEPRVQVEEEKPAPVAATPEAKDAKDNKDNKEDKK